MALEWLDALRERDRDAVFRKARLPFDFRDTRAGTRGKNREGSCGSQIAANAAALTAVLTCLATDTLLHADLVATPEPRFVELEAGGLPAWAKGWAAKVSPGVRAVSTFVHGEGSVHEVVLLVGDDGVHGLWQDVIVEPK